MPPTRCRCTWARRGSLRTGVGLPPVLAFLVLLLSACGNSSDTLLDSADPYSPGIAARTDSPAPQTTEGPRAFGGTDDEAPNGDPAPGQGITLQASMAGNANDTCLGVKKITVEPTALLLFCVEVAEQGQIPLSEVEVSSQELGLNMSSWTPLEDTFSGIPPEGVLLATSAEPAVGGRVAAQIAQEGREIWLDAGAATADSAVDLQEFLADSTVLVQLEDTDLIGRLATAMASGTDGVVSIAKRMGATADALVPFLVFNALIGATVWWMSRHRRGRRAIDHSLDRQGTAPFI